MMARLLYLGFIGFHNIGDEVCYEAFLQLKEKLAGPAEAIPYDLRNKRSIAEIHSETPLSGVVLGGGSLFQGTAFVRPALEAINLGLPLWTFGTGIDYFSENYVRQLYETSLPPSPPQMFDGKELDINALRTIFEQAAFAGVRGPLTKRFSSFLTQPDKTVIIGDPGLVYQPKADSSMLEGVPTKFAAVNWGQSYSCIFGHDEQRTMMELVEGIRCLIRQGYHILIYPMWDHDIEPCQYLYSTIGHQAACTVVPRVHSTDAICTMLSRADLSISFKLHAAVLSARMGTPFISLAYRSKCMDFAMSMGMLSQCIPTSSFHIGSFIAERTADIQAQRDAYRDALAKRCELFSQYYVLWLNSVSRVVFNIP